MPTEVKTPPAASAATSAPMDGADPAPVRADAVVVFDYEPSPPFAYLAHPLHYDVFPVGEGYEILPALRQFHLIPGVGGVRETELVVEGRAQVVAEPSNALAQLVRKGWVEVPGAWEVTAFGQKKVGYYHIYNGTRGRICLPRWVRLYQLGGSAQVARDEAGFREFQRRVAKELLPGLDENVKRGLEQKLLGLQRQVNGRDPTRGTAGVVAATLAGKLEVFKAKPAKGGEGA